MTPQPNTPASQIDVVIEWLRNHYQDYPNIASLCEAMREALATRTEQAVPSVASGVETSTAVLNDLKDWLEGLVEANFNGHVPQSVFSEANEYIERIEALAAPSSAISAPKRDLLDPEVSALRWLLNITTDFDRKDVRTRQAARLLDDYSVDGKTNREHLESLWSALDAAARNAPPAVDAGEREALASKMEVDSWRRSLLVWREASPAELIENTAGLKQCLSNAARLLLEHPALASRPESPPASASPATVAQPVDAVESRKSAKAAAEYEVRQWMGENDVVLKTPAYRNLIALVLAAQPCDSQGCGGEGDSVDAQSIMFLVYEYARISDGFDAAEGDARIQQRTAMQAKANEIRIALATRETEALNDINAILYQCDRGNVSLAWLIAALRGIEQRAALSGLEHVGKESGE